MAIRQTSVMAIAGRNELWPLLYAKPGHGDSLHDFLAVLVIWGGMLQL